MVEPTKRFVAGVIPPDRSSNPNKLTLADPDTETNPVLATGLKRPRFDIMVTPLLAVMNAGYAPPVVLSWIK
jgi:hypothetical protein